MRSKRGQQFLVELFSMIMIFVIIIVFLGIIYLTDGFPFAGIAGQTVAPDLLIYSMHKEFVEYPSVARELRMINVTNHERLGCTEDCPDARFPEYLMHKITNQTPGLPRPEEYESRISLGLCMRWCTALRHQIEYATAPPQETRIIRPQNPSNYESSMLMLSTSYDLGVRNDRRFDDLRLNSFFLLPNPQHEPTVGFYAYEGPADARDRRTGSSIPRVYLYERE